MKQMKNHILTVILFLTGSICFAQDNQSVSGQIAGHDYVDLGLPSGTLWATYNVGATKSTEYGYFFAWGETSPKTSYAWSAYKWTNDEGDTFFKYVASSKFGKVDNNEILLPIDDAATVNWGNAWRMPTTEEQKELIEGCKWEWTDDFKGSGVSGQLGISTINNKEIFLPASGFNGANGLSSVGELSEYWSSSLRKDASWHAYDMRIDKIKVSYNYVGRNNGQSIRAVAVEKTSGVSNVSNKELNIYAENNIIHIANAQAKTNIQVIDVNGKTVASGITDANGSAEIRLSVLKGVYVVSDGNQSTKLVIQ